MKIAELTLGYFKQGDDFAHFLKEANGNIVKAMRLQAASLECTITKLQSLATRLADSDQADKVTMEGQTHVIIVEGPDDLITNLIAESLLSKSEIEEEDLEDMDDEDFEDEDDDEDDD